ncbi:hypothetical protein GQ457_04G024460 [Hibiscus cannabinus]
MAPHRIQPYSRPYTLDITCNYLNLFQKKKKKNGSNPTLDLSVANSAFQPLVEIFLHSYTCPFSIFKRRSEESMGSSTCLRFEYVKDKKLENSLVYETRGVNEPSRARSNRSSFDRIELEQLEICLISFTVLCKTLHSNPRVQLKYARARKDLQLTSHDSVFDPQKMSFKLYWVVWKGKELLNYLFWSTGLQTRSPTKSNKQCAAKDYVTLSASLMVAHM